MNVTKIATSILVSNVLLASWGAQARVARHVPQQTPTVTEQATVRTDVDTHPENEGMCEASRIQVPVAGEGLQWKTIEDCDQD